MMANKACKNCTRSSRRLESVFAVRSVPPLLGKPTATVAFHCIYIHLRILCMRFLAGNAPIEYCEKSTAGMSRNA